MQGLKERWIQTSKDIGDVCPVFRKVWKSNGQVSEAKIYLTALGIYDACLNGRRISDYVLAPGWTSYDSRLQYQCYDITDLLKEENELLIKVGRGWFSSPMTGGDFYEDKLRRFSRPRGIWGKISLSYTDGTYDEIVTDTSWQWGESEILFSEIYDGETVDARILTEEWENVLELDWSYDILIPQEGEKIKEMERIAVKSVITTPKGETVLDFGQEITGYLEFTVHAQAGDEICIQHGEVLDKDGNFYNENYRGAKAEINYICREGGQTYHPVLTFFGFRYVKLANFPGEIHPENFTAIAVYSDIRKTGSLSCGCPEVNQLFSNIFWGQKGNFLDVPTDCPQRDERLGWTGDAQVFVKAACYNYNVEKFFQKWLHDLAADQRKDGGVSFAVPDYIPGTTSSAAWGDAATICPWQVYLAYGNENILQEQFQSMVKWVDYITKTTTTDYLWTGGTHFGDWLGLDAPSGSYKGSSREDLIASAYYAYSVGIVVKAGQVLGKDIEKYKALYEGIVEKFRETYPVYLTQTEYAVAIHFRLAENLQKASDELAVLVKKEGKQLRTGFVGTPYLLHALSDYGHVELAYDLFLRREYPSWLYSVKQGATTIWEHWDGIMENGDFWSADMNSFNHYAYGSVADWVYEKAAGICIMEEAPGFSKVKIAPMPDKRLGWLEASVDTRNGKISSKWTYIGDCVRYEITTPVPAIIKIDYMARSVGPGTYVLWGMADQS